MKYPKMEWGTMEAIVNKIGGEERAAQFLRGELTIKESDLLRRITTVSVSGAKKFVAEDRLQVCNIGWTGDNFKKLFLDKVEENVPNAVIAIHRLERNSLDAPILTELGKRAEAKLVHFFGLIEKQSKGEDGLLLTNGRANIAYIIGSDGNVWTVNAYWISRARYWIVGAVSVDDPHEWCAGDRVLSCDS
jgi:hypothetical protein